MIVKRKRGVRLMIRWLSLICWICCSCGNSTRSGTSVTDVSTAPVMRDSTVYRLVSDRDSLYAGMIGKLETETYYVPVIRFLVDSLVPQYNSYEYDYRSDYIFTDPLRYLTRTELDRGRTLVTLAEDDNGCFHYFLLDTFGSIIWHRFSDTYRTRILGRKFCDWDVDGRKEIVERRENIVSGFVSTREYVFSVDTDGLKLRFCIELSSANYIGADSFGGYLTRRNYEHLGNGLYRITQRESRCDEESNPHGEVSITRYTISPDSLIILYDGGEN